MYEYYHVDAVAAAVQVCDASVGLPPDIRDGALRAGVGLVL